MTRMIDRRDALSGLISPMRDVDRPIYNWHSFKHSYSRDLVRILAQEFRLKTGACVLDPFCGGGTTLLACKELGINSDGFDILPFSVFLSNVKTRDYNLKRLVAERSRFKRSKRLSLKIPALTEIPIARKAFSTNVRNELLKIKQRIEEIRDPTTRDFYNLGMLSILESVSNTSKSGGFLRITKRRVQADAVKTAFLSRVDSMLSDVSTFNETMTWKGVEVEASECDARDLPDDKMYDAVITSPPYPNRHDYTRIYSLEMLFDFVESNDDLKAIRYQTLRSHVEARPTFDTNGYVRPTRLTRLLRKVQNNGTNNPMVAGMLEGYFEDMYLALLQMSDRLQRRGKLALVVSNVRFAGVNIPVDELLFEVGQQAGLRPKAIWTARYRGNSSQQMREYTRKPSRESIVVWEK